MARCLLKKFEYCFISVLRIFIFVLLFFIFKLNKYLSFIMIKINKNIFNVKNTIYYITNKKI
jgi:hypothetical protein